MSNKKYAVDLPAPVRLELSRLLSVLNSGVRRSLLSRLLADEVSDQGILEHPRSVFAPYGMRHTLELHVLRHAGWVHQRPGSAGLLTRLRRDDIEMMFPGLLSRLRAVLASSPPLPRIRRK